MMHKSQSTFVRLTGRFRPSGSILAGLMLAVAGATSAHAQGQIASGQINASGSGPYSYSLSFANAPNATSPIGSIWYSWIPGQFYLPGTPTSAAAPPGWTATVSGASVQFVATSAAFDIAAGSSLSAFGYDAAFSPAELVAAPNSGVSVAYSGGLFSDSGYTFDVQFSTVPEPSPGELLVLGASSLWLVWRRQFQAR